MKYPAKLFTILCLATTALASPVLAQGSEAPPAVAAFLDSIERQTKVEPTYDSLDTDGSGNVTITNLAFSKSENGGQEGVAVKIAEATFANLSDEGDGLHQIGNASFKNMTADVKSPEFSITVTLPNASAEGWYVMEAGDAPTPAQAFRAAATVARKMESGKITIAAQGQTVTIDGFATTWDGDPKTGAGNSTSTISNIAIPGSLIAMADQGGMLKQLGYDGLNFDIASAGTMSLKGENVDYAFDVGLTGRDIATIKLGLSAGDIPLAVYAQLQKMQEAGQQPDIAALMPQIQGISLADASIRFEDQSITKKVLPLIAAMQGMDEKTMLQSVGPMMQMGLMQLQNQAFADQALAAVNAFLAEPKSLTIKVKPASPIKVSDLMTLNPAAPGEAITKLGVSVSAND
jgi:hypothetical protein